MRDQQRLDALESAVRGVVDEQQPGGPRPGGARDHTARPRRPLVLFMLMVWALIGWIWSTKPAFLFGERTVVVQSEAHEEATLRFALFLERGRVDAYVRQNGRMPPTLEAAGPIEDGVSLVPTSDGYELIGHRGAAQLRLNNRMNADSFLGTSLDVLRREGPARP